MTTPNNPSEPTKSSVREKPVLFLWQRPPTRVMVPSARNDFEAHHVVFCDAIFEATRAASVGGDVAAERALFQGGGVGRIIPSFGGGGVL